MQNEQYVAPTLPFSAFVGQNLLKLALLSVAVNPKIGGLLIRGEKGSGKSVIVRALADLLPPIDVVADCPFNCDPHDIENMCPLCRERIQRGEKLPIKRVRMRIVNLPIGATEDMVVGTIDIEKVLREGIRAFRPGILARANRNILYIDEINLLPDYIADLILDAAAMGWNYVERENISISHPARFILIGTMNPEEGDLRPQLLDRLALCVDISGIREPEARVEIIKRNIEFGRNPKKFIEAYKQQQEALRRKIEYARRIINEVKIPEHILYLIASLCTNLEVDGHRPDIVIARTSMALAALDGRKEVIADDVRIASYMALIHRTRKGGLLEPPKLEEINDAFVSAVKSVKAKFKIKVKLVGKKTTDYLASTMREPVVLGEKQKIKMESQDFFRVRKQDTKAPTRLPKKSSRFQWLKWDASDKAKKLEKETRKRRVLRSLLRMKLLTHLGIVAPHSLNVEPDVEYSSYAKVQSDRFGLASIPIKHLVYPKAEPLRISGMMGIEDIPEPTGYPRIQYSHRRIYADGSLHGIPRTSAYGSRGHVITYRIPHGRYSDIAIIPTILNSVKRDPHNRTILPEDIRIKLRCGKRRLLMIIVLDASDSMRTFIPIIIRVLFKFQKIAWRMRSLVGLITCHGNRAEVITYPTTNINKLIGGMFNIEFSGRTPLAKGLLLAHRLLISQRIKHPDAIARILLVSDGLANIPLERPVDSALREKIYSEAQADVLAIAKLLGRKGIRIIAVNPWHIEKWGSAIFISPTKLLMLTARITGGVYIGLDVDKILTYDKYWRMKVSTSKETMERIADNIIMAIFESIM